MKSPSAPAATSFAELGLSETVLAGLKAIGYEAPSPIQAATIPALLEGRDVLGQAQTGTGKTAAFALPILSQLDLTQREPQVLVMVPTRELAIQVAEAFQKYASAIPGFHVVPIYGGQSYTPQLNALKRGAQVVVGTPGRITDHLDRGTLTLAKLKHVVLDEADEMLAMGFVDAIEAIFAQTPPERQVALFSATMAPQIKRIAERHLRNPREVLIQSKTTTAANIRQRFWMVSGLHKLDALTRILEVEDFDAMLVFARTKQVTAELAEKLSARGFASAALNGDILQAQRERTVQQLKDGHIDILVATDVAARGLDVPRISHVVNFDVPYDTESYVHRIGRTGRAGRSGEAILFIAPRERNMLRLIERATRQPIEPMTLPSIDEVNTKRVAKFKTRVTDVLAKGVPDAYRKIVEEMGGESGVELVDVAAALLTLVQGKTPLLLSKREQAVVEEGDAAPARGKRRGGDEDDAPERGPRVRNPRFAPQDTYRIEVGSRNGVNPGNIVGLIANEAGLDGSEINGIDIYDDYSTVRLPVGMPPHVLKRMQRLKLKGRELAMSLVASAGEERGGRGGHGPRGHVPHAAHSLHAPKKHGKRRD
ncbi:MAG TPA: DEAD/DEAH box helicase [Steroidobacteraceae bacterium]|nr:DEAD/DEAH box helicase [Steroidobacteraceae bacterium]